MFFLWAVGNWIKLCFYHLTSSIVRSAWCPTHPEKNVSALNTVHLGDCMTPSQYPASCQV